MHEGKGRNNDGDNAGQQRQYMPPLREFEEIQLTNHVRGVASQAESLFREVERYEVINALRISTDKRISAVTQLLEALERGVQEVNLSVNQYSGRVVEVRDAMVEKMLFLNQLRAELRFDQEAFPGCLTDARRSIVQQLGFVRSAVDNLYNSRGLGTNIEPLSNHEKWRALGGLHAGIGQFVSHLEAFSSEPIAQYAFALMELTSAVETDFILSCGRRATEPLVGGIESVCKTRLGWRLGLPPSRGALKVSLRHLSGSERDEAEDFIEPRVERDSWLEFPTYAERGEAQREFLGSPTELYAGIVASREVYRPGSNRLEDIKVGAMLYHQIGRVFEINAMKVDEGVRGGGVGAQMVTAFLKSIIKKGEDARVFIDIPHDDRSGYRHAEMSRFLHSFGFTATAGAAQGYTRMKWERQLCAGLLNL
jgi:hypothetical protein